MDTPVAGFRRPALIVVDVQAGFDDASFWGPRNNPSCENNIVELLRFWRTKAWPLVFGQHDSDNPQSPLSPTQDGHRFKDMLDGTPDSDRNEKHHFQLTTSF